VPIECGSNADPASKCNDFQELESIADPMRILIRIPNSAINCNDSLRLGVGRIERSRDISGRTYYSYPTVFIRTGANLAQLLLKTIKIDNRS
jgi:hypothetical protein